jgi:hypothetical protein
MVIAVLQGAPIQKRDANQKDINAGLMVVEIIFMEYAKTVTNLAMTMTMWMMKEERMKTSKVQIPQKVLHHFHS